MASCSCCDDPEPGENRLLVLIVLIGFATGSIVLIRAYLDDLKVWLSERELLVPAEQAVVQLPGGVGVGWMTLGIGFLSAVVLLWIGSRILIALGLVRDR